VLHAFIVFAAETLEETEEHSHTAFYVAGGVLALWAVLVSFVGIRGHENWPSSDGAARGIMGISAVLVVAAMATAVLTA
jgi:nitric oxide reductase large subunit